MVKVKSQAQIEANYKGSAGEAANRYTAAIPTVQWQAQALDGQSLFEEKMSDPAVLARRSTNIAKVSDAEFRAALTEKGAPVLARRMRNAAGKMAQNFAPYRAALEAVTLPARSADAMANIDNRLKPIVQALIDTKAAQG